MAHCGNPYCTCCLTAYPEGAGYGDGLEDGLVTGLRAGYKLGRGAGYEQGYLDAHVTTPSLFYEPKIEECEPLEPLKPAPPLFFEPGFKEYVSVEWLLPRQYEPLDSSFLPKYDHRKDLAALQQLSRQYEPLDSEPTYQPPRKYEPAFQFACGCTNYCKRPSEHGR